LLRPDLVGNGLAPLVLYFHGGGFVSGNPDTHEPFGRLLAEAANVCVLLVDYRLAPEWPHPAAVEDARAAWEAARTKAADWRVDPQRLVISGDSAGANVAAVLANSVPRAQLAAQILLFPVTDHPSGQHASYTGPAWGFTPEFMAWVWSMYAPGISPDDPSVSPLRHPALPRLPPTFVATAQYDILRDEGLAYVAKLRASGTTVTHHHTADMHHNFFVNPATVARFPQCSVALDELATWLRRTVASTPQPERNETAE
jgi:acetyl esterase